MTLEISSSGDEREATAQLWKTREGCRQATSRGQGAVLQAASGPSNLVWGHEPCVPKGPECNTTIGSNHQVGDTTIVEGQAEPTFWRKLQCPTNNIADDIGVTYEDLVAVLLLLGISSVDVVPEGSLNPGSIFIILLGAK